MRREKPSVTVKPSVGRIIVSTGFASLFILTATFMKAVISNGFRITCWCFGVAFLAMFLMDESYRVKAFEDRVIKRFLFRDVLTLYYDEIDSIDFNITKLGNQYYDINSSKGRIRMEIDSRNVEELIAWIEMNDRKAGRQ